MAVPKKKMSRSRTRRRRSANEKLNKLHLVECPQCHDFKEPHRICPTCGTFRGVKYLATNEDTLE